MNPMLPLRFGGWANLAIAAAHLVALGWAWTVFRWVDIEAPMRDLADQNAVLPYLLTLLMASFFLAFEAEAVGGTLQAADDALDARFFAPDDLPELAFPSTQDAAARVRGHL